MADAFMLKCNVLCTLHMVKKLIDSHRSKCSATFYKTFRLPLPSAKIKDGHLEAFGDRALAMRSLEDPLVLFVPPTLGFLDQVLQSTATLQTQLHAVDVPFLVSCLR